MRKTILAVIAAAIAVSSMAAQADTYLKMRMAGAGDFYLSETTDYAFVYPDNAAKPVAYKLIGVKDDCRFYDSRVTHETIGFCSNENRSHVWIGITGEGDKTPVTFELDKRYVEEVQIGQ